MKSNNDSKRSFWISSRVNTTEHTIYHFKKNIKIFDEKILNVKVSADSRYKLFVNGEYVLEGPCIGTDNYYDEIDITKILRKGINTIEAIVLYAGGEKGLSCIKRKNRVAFWLDGVFDNGRKIVSDKSWDVAIDGSVKFYMSRFIHRNGYPNEIHFPKKDLEWEKAEELCTNFEYNDWGVFGKYDPVKRPIKLCVLDDEQTLSVSKSNVRNIKEEFEFLPLKIKGEKQKYIVFDLGKHSVGYPYFKFKGSGRIGIIYSEAYSFFEPKLKSFEKYVRSDKNGHVVGCADVLWLDNEIKEYFPFMTRAARYIKIIISECSEIEIIDVGFREYHYPLNIVNDFRCSNGLYNKMWDISINTLQNCMFDTYVDCPYYEMEQYTMDAYLEILYTYLVSDDMRFVKKAITDIWQTQNYEGMQLASAPMVYKQITPIFSLFWIMMVEKYLLFSGDSEFVRKLLSSVYSILDWFEKFINDEGVVGATSYGKFIDWVDTWENHYCIENAKDSPSSVVNLMYLYCLNASEKLFLRFNKKGMGAELEQQYNNLKESINKVFYDADKKIYRDTPQGGYSEHQQIWAVLSGAISGVDAIECLEESKKEYVHKCSYAYQFFRNRAYEMCGMNVDLEKLLENWKTMVDLDTTTWFESTGRTRSDCHGWSCVPIYEFTTKILGVQPLDEGYGKVLIAPEFRDLKYAKGKVSTPYGSVDISWKYNELKYCIKILSSEKITKLVKLPDGRVYSSNDAIIEFVI